ncbi:MAG: Gfo/Idh/MocA family oxidoreductase [Clostridiaceae bacterium]|jgi:predicted dehydrogenase|nr:Gfo/Idh/MocA family oxidoreductase [Clostridiaceae bacterium]
MLKACVIGMGNIGNVHARVYSQYDKVQLIGVCDIIPERAEAAGKKYGVPFYLNAEEMLRKLKPDICSITTGGFEYSSDHYIPTIQALNAGCHVLCEKPICNDLEKAQIMVDTAKKLKRCFAINLNHRFTPAARIVKQWQNEGKIGHLLFINMALWIGRFESSFDTEYYHLKALNPHSVDIMRHFGGDIDTVHCFATKAPGRDIWSTASINIKFKNGAVGHLTSSYDIKRGHPMERCEVAGTKGRAVFEDMWKEAVLYPADSLVKEVYTNPTFGGFTEFYDTFRDRITSFADQVARGDKPEDIDGSGEQGLEASRVIHAAIESIKTGLPVKVETIKK